MGKYELIAFDMDGTLLNSEKRVDGETRRAIAEAAAAGKTVAINSGRCFVEMRRYLDELPSVAYAVSTSGAYIYDCARRRAVFTAQMPPDAVPLILVAARLEDAMPQIMTRDRDIVERARIADCARYQVPMYQKLFYEVGFQVESVEEYYLSERPQALKVNIYHSDAESRERTRARLSGLDAELIDSDLCTLECTPKNISKASGLTALCTHLGLSERQAIAVGDADNDICMLSVAGLPVAMGNANGRVKAIARAVVADCDHSGCAEAIRKYLL